MQQPTIETATYGSEFVASRTCVEVQIMDIRLCFRYVGVQYLWLNAAMYSVANESMIKSAIRSDANLHKRHIILSFHCVNQGMAFDVMTMIHIPDRENPVDISSKYWSHDAVC